MKRIIETIGTGLLIVILAPLVIILLVVVVLPVLVWFAIQNGLEKLFIKLRNDPKSGASKIYHVYRGGSFPEGEKALHEYFDVMVDVIKESSSAARGDTKADEVDGEKDDSETLPYIVVLSATLETKHGTALLTMEAFGGRGNDDEFYACQDGDLPPYLTAIYTQTDGQRLVFDVNNDVSFEFLAAVLRSGVKISDAQQPWVKIADDVYMVNYTVKSDTDKISRDYGYRSRFSDARVRMYFFDKKHRQSR